MTSLVERLRAKADTYTNRVECAASLECEAADTIEALCEALEGVLDAHVLVALRAKGHTPSVRLHQDAISAGRAVLAKAQS
jgi:hypothetical protein